MSSPPQAPGPVIGGSVGAIAISSVSASRQADGCGAGFSAPSLPPRLSAAGSTLGASAGRGLGSGTRDAAGAAFAQAISNRAGQQAAARPRNPFKLDHS